MKAVYGLYRDGQAAQQAVNRLRAAGIADRDITVISAQPMEDYEFGHMDKATWMWWLACLGGLVGSGRTELLRLVYGLDQPKSGEVLIEGKKLRPNRPDLAIRRGLGWELLLRRMEHGAHVRGGLLDAPLLHTHTE